MERGPTKHVHLASVRVTREALEGATVLPTASVAAGMYGFDISTMADTPEEAADALNKALVRLAMAFQREAEKIQREHCFNPNCDGLIRYSGFFMKSCPTHDPTGAKLRAMEERRA